MQPLSALLVLARVRAIPTAALKATAPVSSFGECGRFETAADSCRSIST